MSENSITDILPSNQKFACLSFFEGKDKNDKNLRYIRVGGVFNDYDKAYNHAKEINQVDHHHNVFVGELGKWLPFDTPDSTEFVEHVEYANKQLNEIMDGYHKNQEKAKLFYEKDKNSKIIKNYEGNIEVSNKNMKEMKGKLSKAKTQKEIDTITKSLDEINKQIKENEDKIHSLNKKNEKILNDMNNVDNSSKTNVNEQSTTAKSTTIAEPTTVEQPTTTVEQPTTVENNVTI